MPPNIENKDYEVINMCKFLPMRKDRIEKIRAETEKDEALSAVKEIIRKGWPEEKDLLPTVTTPCFSYADELTNQVGIIFKGDKVVIPRTMREDLKKEMHSAH